MPITITAKRHLFRRCGVNHPKDPTQYPDGTFTDTEIKTLSADPMLTVKVTEAETETEPESKTEPEPKPESESVPAPKAKKKQR